MTLVAANPGKREAAAIRREKALALRVQGKSFRQIGAELGVSGKTACEYVHKVLADLAAKEQGNARIARQIDLERINKGIQGLTPAYEAGDPKAVMAMCRLLERRSRLLGLDAPSRVLHGGDPDAPPIAVADLTQTERADRLRELIAVTRSRQAPALLTYQPTSNGHVADGAGGVSQDD